MMNPTLLLCSLCWLLTGCSPDTPEAMLQDYLDRVANTLEQPVATAEPPPLLLLPRRRERRLEVTELRTGLLETLDFNLCALLPLIAERNSSLGRVMRPSMAMSYELRFFERLHPCYLKDRQQPLKDPDFSALLSETHRIKQSNLPAEVWNGIFTSEALEKNLSLSAGPVPLTGNPGYGDSLRALHTLNRYRSLAAEVAIPDKRFSLPLDHSNIEQHYQALTTSEYGSELFQSLALLTRYLNQTASTLEAAMAKRPVCFGNKPTPKAKILKNVFSQYYAARVQPYMAMTQRQGQPWLTAMERLMDPSNLPPGAVPLSNPIHRYRQTMIALEAQGSLWHHYQAAIKKHTQAWQDLLGQCGLMPRGPVA